MNKTLQQRLDVAKWVGTEPAIVLAEAMIDLTLEREIRLDAAKSLMPYCYPRLKQLEIHDERDQRRPHELARDITDLVEVAERRRARDLLGDDAGLADLAVPESDRLTVP